MKKSAILGELSLVIHSSLEKGVLYLFRPTCLLKSKVSSLFKQLMKVSPVSVLVYWVSTHFPVVFQSFLML